MPLFDLSFVQAGSRSASASIGWRRADAAPPGRRRNNNRTVGSAPPPPAAAAAAVATRRRNTMTMIVADADVAANDNAAGINSSPAPPETAPPETAAATATTTGKKCAPPKKDGRRDDDNDDENARQLHRQLQQLVVIDKFPYIVSSSERQHPPSTSARTPTTAGASDDDEDDDDAPATNSSGATRNGSGGHRGTDDDDDGGGGQISFLVEIAKATIPKRRRRGGARGDGDRGDRGGNNGSKSGSSRKVLGMHCTAHWVGPVNPSGRRRRERPLHRTRTLRITETDVSGGGGVVGPSSEAAVVSRSDSVYSGASPLAGGGGSGKEMAVDCTEHVFTVNDASLFLFRTTMKQLVNASLGGPRSAAAAAMADDDDDDDGGVGDDERDDERDDDARAASSSSSSSPCVVDGGGLRFDVFERPLDVLNSVYTTILADYSMSEQEASAMTDGEKKSSSSSSSSPLFNNAYRLVGSVFLTPHDILSRCDETRFECEMMENWRGMQRQQQRGGGGPRGGGGGGGGASMTSMTTPKRVDGARLALRIRVASEFDVAFMRSIEEFYDEEDAAKGVNATLRSALMRARNATHLEPAQLVTEIDENVLTAENTVMKLVNLTPAAMESVRYMMSNDVERRVMVKPHPDPSRPPEETMWMTEDELRSECRGPSTNWIQAGWSDRPDSLGRVYLEVLQCRGLPNTDAGGSVGNKTDPFVSVVYGDVMVQTEVINDSLSPMWMPWSSRAFVFQLSHPSAAVHVSVVDYDFGPLDHEAIGRCSIRIGTRFHPGTVYTLSYKLYDSPNLMEKGEVMGTITVRLRVEINDEKRYLMEGYRPPEQRFVNSQQKKTHRIARYTVDGPHDEEVFEMNLFRSHINELLTQKRYMMYAIYDASRSLIFWRGQVKVGNVWLPLHSAVLFFSLTHVVETPHLLPSFVLFGCGWILLANMLLRVSHPNPWHRGHSFAHYWNIMVHGKSSHATNKRGVRIKPLQGHEEASRLMEKWEQRLADEDADYAKQLDLDAKIKTITDGANVRTRTKAKSAIADPISALAGARLLPYQQRLSGYCNKMRYVRNVLTWNESIVSFFLTLSFFGAAFVALFVPWRFLLLWTSRLVVWIFLGPWMRLADLFFHEETVRQKAKASNKAMELFHQQHVMAKMLRENALKMKAFRVKLFGKYITNVPGFNLTRHEDVPLPESSAEPYQSEEEVKTVKFIPSQELSGAMIPITDDTIRSQSRKQKERDTLVNQYRRRVTDRKGIDSATENDELDEGYELIGTEDRVVCLHSTFAEVPGALDTAKMESTHKRFKSDGDVVVADKEIQLAMESQLQPHDASKSKWVFSASIKLSLRKETIEGGSGIPAICDDTAAICADTTSNGMIEQMDGLAEEGVEIVPFFGSFNEDNAGSDSQTALDESSGNDHVSVFYFKDETQCQEAKDFVDDHTTETDVD